MKRINTILTLWLAAATAAVASIPEHVAAAQRSWKARAQAGNNSTELILLILLGVVAAGLVAAGVTAFVKSKVGGLQ